MRNRNLIRLNNFLIKSLLNKILLLFHDKYFNSSRAKRGFSGFNRSLTINLSLWCFLVSVGLVVNFKVEILKKNLIILTQILNLLLWHLRLKSASSLNKTSRSPNKELNLFSLERKSRNTSISAGANERFYTSFSRMTAENRRRETNFLPLRPLACQRQLKRQTDLCWPTALSC